MVRQTIDTIFIFIYTINIGIAERATNPFIAGVRDVIFSRTQITGRTPYSFIFNFGVVSVSAYLKLSVFYLL